MLKYYANNKLVGCKKFMKSNNHLNEMFLLSTKQPLQPLKKIMFAKCLMIPFNYKTLLWATTYNLVKMCIANSEIIFLLKIVKTVICFDP